jgi:DNA polymerase III subunit gamma/tau
VGQDAVVQTLHRALSSGRIAHAFLFTGSRGVGKTTLARIMARCLTCVQGPTGTPCGTCAVCVGIQQGSAVDLLEIDGASNTGIDQIRELQEMARFLPQLARYKIFIIDEVHMLTSSAFNALLKILEEPPPHLKFIFATTEPHKIPVTVLSRCQRYDFRRIPTAIIVQRLQHVLAQEKLRISAEGLFTIARAAEGGMRDALSLCDQVISFCGANNERDISDDEVTQALGLLDRRAVGTCVDAVLTRHARGVVEVTKAAFDKGHDLKQLLGAVGDQLRHISVAQAVGSVQGHADLADDDVARVDAWAKQVDAADVVRLLGMCLEGIERMGEGNQPRITTEWALLRMCRRAPMGDAMLISEALVRLEALAKGRPVPPLRPSTPGQHSPAMAIAQAAFAPPSSSPVVSSSLPAAQLVDVKPAPPTPAPTQTPAPPPAPVPTAPSHHDGEDEPLLATPAATSTAVSAEVPGIIEPEDDDASDLDPHRHLPLIGIDDDYRRFLDALSVVAPQKSGLFLLAQMVRDGSALALHFELDLHKQQAQAAWQQPSLAQAWSKLFAATPAFVTGLVAGGPPTAAQAQQRALDDAEAALQEHARQHPVVQKAMALFGGEVKSVRRRVEGDR